MGGNVVTNSAKLTGESVFLGQERELWVVIRKNKGKKEAGLVLARTWEIGASLIASIVIVLPSIFL